MDRHEAAALDAHLTGNWGEDSIACPEPHRRQIEAPALHVGDIVTRRGSARRGEVVQLLRGTSWGPRDRARVRWVAIPVTARHGGMREHHSTALASALVRVES